MSAHRRFLELRQRRAREAWSCHVGDPARERTVAVLTDWLVGAVELLPSTIPGHGMAEVAAPVRIGDRLRDRGLGQTAEALEAFLSSGSSQTEPMAIRAGMALGEALAQAVASRPEEPLVRLTHWLISGHATLLDPYLVILTERARLEPRIRFAIRRLLHARVETFGRDPQRVALCASQAPMTRWLEARAERGDGLRGLWEGGLGHDVFRLYDSLHFDWIRRLDERAFTVLVQRFAIPGPATDLLRAMAWQRNLGDLASLLRRAPTVAVEPDGTVVRGGLTILLLGTASYMMQERTRRIDEDGRRLSRLPAAAARDVEDAIETLVHAVFARRDGSGLAKLWLRRILWEDMASNVWNLPLLPLPSLGHESQGRSIVSVLIQGLASRLPYPASADDELREADASERWPCLLASVATVALSDDAEVARSASTLLARLIRSDLTQSIGLDRIMGHPYRVAGSVIRSALRHEPDPAAWFAVLWSSKEATLSRERRWTGDTSHGSLDTCNAALVAVAVGLAAVAPAPLPSEAQRSLFGAVNAAIAGQLLAPTRSDPGMLWHKARRACLALWPRLFAECDASRRSRLLADLLRPFARPTETLAWDLVELAHAGVSADDIGSALRSLGHEPASLIAVVLSDRRNRGDGSRITLHEVQVLEALERDLARA